MPLNPQSLERAFRKVSAAPTPHQSTGSNVKFPGSSIAATDLGVTRGHLHRVLTGERQSPTLLSRWKTWLANHPEFSRLQAR